MKEDERINLLPEKSMKKISEFILSISKSQNQPNEVNGRRRLSRKE